MQQVRVPKIKEIVNRVVNQGHIIVTSILHELNHELLMELDKNGLKRDLPFSLKVENQNGVFIPIPKNLFSGLLLDGIYIDPDFVTNNSIIEDRVTKKTHLWDRNRDLYRVFDESILVKDQGIGAGSTALYPKIILTKEAWIPEEYKEKVRSIIEGC